MLTEKTAGRAPDGTELLEYLFESPKLRFSVLNLGGILKEISVPDRRGVFADVNLGYDSAEAYLQDQNCFGAVIGRCCNRIANGAFELDGVSVQVTCNSGKHHLHGGTEGFHRKVWDSAILGDALKLSYTSCDGEEGYPGTLRVSVYYSLEHEDTLQIRYEAETDKPTLCNLTNHAYFNLRGDGGSSLEDLFYSPASVYCPTDRDEVPTGELCSVENTPFDFRHAKEIGREARADTEQIQHANGYDHHLMVPGEGLRLAGTLKNRATGRMMDCQTTMPGFQLYVSQGLRAAAGKRGAVYGPYSGICIETQYVPDAIHHKAFQPPILRPGETYDQVTQYRFYTE